MASLLGTIFISIILPVFLLIGTGWLLDRKFRLDMPTLSKLNFYVFVPALIFVKIVQSTIRLDEARNIVIVSVLLVAILYGLSRLASRLLSLEDGGSIVILGTVFFNAGNYGLPLAELAYPGEGAGIMAVILMVQNLLSFTFGLWILESHQRSVRQVVAGLARVPVLIAIIAALLLQGLDVSIPAPFMKALGYLAAGLIPVALLTLGAQLARSENASARIPLSVLCIGRLILSPLIAYGLVRLLGMTGTVAEVCIIAAGLPTAVNVYILAGEYKRNSALASRAVFWTTLASAFTLTTLIALAQT